MSELLLLAGNKILPTRKTALVTKHSLLVLVNWVEQVLFVQRVIETFLPIDSLWGNPLVMN